MVPKMFQKVLTAIEVLLYNENNAGPGPEVIKLFSCSTQLSMKFQMLISIKITRNSAFLGSAKPRMLFLPFINVKGRFLKFRRYHYFANLFS